MRQKTVKRRVFNRDTGWYEEVEEKLDSFVFTDEDRLMVVREYLESGVAANAILEKYKLSSRQVLFNWMDKFLNREDCLPLCPPHVGDNQMTNKDPDKEGQEKALSRDKEIQRLRQALELEKLRSKAFETMVDEAEKTFNIPIRKKSGTKQ
ncbi:transposase [Proteiniphilum propionicum]|uniref:transposase n=1 Tax=Proteiniphilum propionicum TaxID=2829812 RepID=UPI001EEA9FEF|nr:transposase [Proteiniphilum propionicum]ULB35730.1 transposase [Proteiniphilum propionicum]